MRIDELNCLISTIDNRPVRVRVFLPNGYETLEKRYPVVYVNDGQDVFRDEDVFWGKESLRFEQYYKDYGMFMPEFILVAIDSPNNNAKRTQQYSPYAKSFHVPENVNFEPYISGLGKEYLAWMVNELKPEIDNSYRTLTSANDTGICGYSTGALNSIYAVLSYPDVFTRVIAMSSAVYIWMDCLVETLKTSTYDHIQSVYLDVGTNEFGRMTTKEEFFEGTEIIYREFLERGVPKDVIKYNIYEGAMHNTSAWRDRFPDALRWIFRENTKGGCK